MFCIHCWHVLEITINRKNHNEFGEFISDYTIKVKCCKCSKITNRKYFDNPNKRLGDIIY